MAKRVFVVDNYDSFVHVLTQYIGCQGAKPIIYRNDTPDLINLIDETAPDALLISPGPGWPKNAGLSNNIIQHFSGKLPILGVCLGHQCIGETFGGKITRIENPLHGKTSEISHNGTGLFKNIKQSIKGTRYHSLLVDADFLPEELEVSASTNDGLIMGLNHKKHPTYGIQFHLESILTESGNEMMENFLALV